MQTDVLFFDILLASIIIGVYFVATTFYAMRRRDELGKDVADYLDSDAPQVCKRLVFKLFSITKLDFVLPRITYGVFFGKKAPQKSQDSNEKFISELDEARESFCDKQKKTYVQLILSCMGIHVIRSPISTVLLLLLMTLMMVIGFIFNKLKPNTIESKIMSVQDSIETLR